MKFDYIFANRQPPTANRQPPTANRQPPTAKKSGQWFGLSQNSQYRNHRHAVCLTLLFATVPALACNQTYSIHEPPESRTSSSTGHNIGRFQYDQSIDAWVITETWYIPEVDDYDLTSDGLTWTSSDGSYAWVSIIDQPSNGGGGGGGEGGGGGPGGGVVNGAEGKPLSAKDQNGLRCIDDEPPKKLDNISVIGFPGSPIRAIMVGAANGWVIVQQRVGGGSPLGSDQSNPIEVSGRISECPREQVDREEAVQRLYWSVAWPFCAANLHQGKYFEVEFSGGRKGIYQGSDGECIATHAFHEIVGPGC